MAKSIFRHARVTGIAAVVPEKCINIDDEIEFFNNDKALLERNKKILGLGTRYVVEDGTAVSNLLDAAAERLFDGMKLDRSSVDALIVVTSSPDYHYPATACVLQGRLGLSEECSCFDVGGLACSAYVHGLWLAHSLVESGATNHCLVLAGDLTSTHSDRRNRNSNMLFGDAGTATLVERTEDDCQAWFITGTRGSGWNTLIAPAGGYALPVRSDNADLEIVDETGNVWRMYDDIMKGMSVFKFTTDVGPRGIADILEMSGKTKDDVDYFAIHQANKQIVRTVANFAGLPKGKFSADAFGKYGNCGAAAVTMELVNRLESGPLSLVCLATFGVGLSWGFALLDFAHVYFGGVETYTAPAGMPTRAETIKKWIEYYRGGNA